MYTQPDEAAACQLRVFQDSWHSDFMKKVSERKEIFLLNIFMGGLMWVVLEESFVLTISFIFKLYLNILCEHFSSLLEFLMKGILNLFSTLLSLPSSHTHRKS